MVIENLNQINGCNKLYFLCNNLKGLQTLKKCLKLFKYFKNKTFANSILFLQETHYTKQNEIKSKDKFKGIHTFHMGNQVCVKY